MRTFNFLYGTVEIRAKLGGGENTGAWPVVWMLDASCQPSVPTGTDDNCNGQEIDVAEILKSDFTHVNQQIHVDNYTRNDQCTATISDTSQNFHVYQLDWSEGSLVYKIDGTTTCRISGRYIPSAPMFVMIDVFAGSYGGDVKNASLPWTTLVDYVKVTQDSRVVFVDDFDGKPVCHFPPAVSASALSSKRPHHLASRVTRFLPWLISAMVMCLLGVAAMAAARFRISTRASGS
jgi:beta-glucanase (GH16 family)